MKLPPILLKRNCLPFLPSYFNPLLTISATSITCTLSSTFMLFNPSSNIVRQYGQQTQTVRGSFFKASSTRATLIRVPSLSYIHIRPPSAPQQNDFSRRRSISEDGRPLHPINSGLFRQNFFGNLIQDFIYGHFF